MRLPSRALPLAALVAVALATAACTKVLETQMIWQVRHPLPNRNVSIPRSDTTLCRDPYCRSRRAGTRARAHKA